MRTSLLLGMIAALLMLPFESAMACQFGRIPTPFADVLSHSRNVGIVRIMSSEVVKDEGGLIRIDAHVQRIETLRGKPYPIRTIRYTTSDCLDLHLDAGKYFLLVTDNDDQDYALDAFGENVVSLYAFGYMPPRDWAHARFPEARVLPAMTRLRHAIAGQGDLPAPEILEGYKEIGAMFNSVSDQTPQPPSTGAAQH